MIIYIDPRSGSGDLPPYFPPNTVELLNLNSGDAMGVGNGPYGSLVWGIEVKKLDDVVGSLQNGRLVEQLGKMQEDYDARYLLVEGEFRSNKKTGKLEQRKRVLKSGKWVEFWQVVKYGNKREMGYCHFMSWLMSVLIGTGTGYLQTTCRQETADLVACIGREYDKSWDDRKSVKVFNDSQVPGLVIPSIPMEVARKLAEGMGYEKAAKAAEYFKTVRRMVNASVDEWREVPGIDKVLANRVVSNVDDPHVTKRRTRRKGGAK